MLDKRPHGTTPNDLMRECFRVNRGLMEASRQLTEGTGVTGAQWGVLTALGQGSELRTVAETARQMGLARQSVQRVTDVLAGNGLVEYLPNPDDKRSRLAEITPAGRVLLAQLEQQQQAWVNDIAAECSAAEVAAASRLLRRMRQRMQGS
jgi:DNA-binding MarR family transcriptional regulator